MSTLVQLCQRVMRATGYNPPSTFNTSQTPDAKRLVELVNEAGNELLRSQWRRLTFEATISASTTTTYSLPSDFWEGINNTFWSRTQTEQNIGPINEQDWQLYKATDFDSALVTGWRLEYTQGTPVLVLLDAPAASSSVDTMILEYKSKNWIVNTTSSAVATIWSNDAERPIWDDHLMYTEIKWRWLRAKGADFEMDFANAQAQKDSELSRDKGGSQKLRMGGDWSRFY